MLLCDPCCNTRSLCPLMDDYSPWGKRYKLYLTTATKFAPQASRHFYYINWIMLNHTWHHYSWIALIIAPTAKSSSRYAVEKHSICLLPLRISFMASLSRWLESGGNTQAQPQLAITYNLLSSSKQSDNWQGWAPLGVASMQACHYSWSRVTESNANEGNTIEMKRWKPHFGFQNIIYLWLQSYFSASMQDVCVSKCKIINLWTPTVTNK